MGALSHCHHCIRRLTDASTERTALGLVGRGMKWCKWCTFTTFRLC